MSRTILHALQGAIGFLTKDATPARLRRAIHAAAAGQTALDHAVQQPLLAAALAGAQARTPTTAT